MPAEQRPAAAPDNEAAAPNNERPAATRTQARSRSPRPCAVCASRAAAQGPSWSETSSGALLSLLAKTSAKIICELKKREREKQEKDEEERKSLSDFLAEVSRNM
jgi:hypothetical protein